MKHIFVGLIVSLAFVALTQASSLSEGRADSATCQLPTVCGKREDGFCQTFTHTCQLNNVNCMLDKESTRKWAVVDNSECSRLKDINKIGVCDSTCKNIADCKSTEPACGASDSGTQCKVYEDLCILKTAACEDSDLFPAVLRRCVKAGICTLEDKGPCADK